MAARLEQAWKREIERAIDKVKMGPALSKKRAATDRWFRRLWYINEWRAKRSKAPGPRIIRE